MPQERDMPLQKAVAILGNNSDSMPSALAMARTTLSAQYRPDEKDSSADFRTSSIDVGFICVSDRLRNWSSEKYYIHYIYNG